MGRPSIDITGNKYGALKVIKKTNNRNSKGQFLDSEYDCFIIRRGNIKLIIE